MNQDLNEAISAIHLRFGEHALAKGSMLPPPQPWPTGVKTVDRLTGLGGLPKGRLTVLQGKASSGKLSLALALLASATRELAQAVVIDPSRRFDPWALLPFNPNLDALTVARPPDAICAAECAISLAKAGAGFLLVFLWEGSGVSPSWLASLEAAAARSGTIVVWATEVVPSVLAHASSFTLGLERQEWIWEQGHLTGLQTRARCLKNKVSAVAGLTGTEVEADLEVRYPIAAELFPAVSLDEVSAGEEALGWAQSAVG